MAAIGLLISGCDHPSRDTGNGKPPGTPRAEFEVAYDTIWSLDRNHDGKYEEWRFIKDGKVVKIERTAFPEKNAVDAVDWWVVTPKGISWTPGQDDVGFDVKWLFGQSYLLGVDLNHDGRPDAYLISCGEHAPLPSSPSRWISAETSGLEYQGRFSTWYFDYAWLAQLDGRQFGMRKFHMRLGATDSDGDRQPDRWDMRLEHLPHLEFVALPAPSNNEGYRLLETVTLPNGRKIDLLCSVREGQSSEIVPPDAQSREAFLRFISEENPFVKTPQELLAECEHSSEPAP